MCPTEITAFSDRYEDFAKLNTEVLGVSVDSQYSLLAWTQMGRSYTLCMPPPPKFLLCQLACLPARLPAY